MNFSLSFNFFYESLLFQSSRSFKNPQNLTSLQSKLFFTFLFTLNLYSSLRSLSSVTQTFCHLKPQICCSNFLSFFSWLTKMFPRRWEKSKNKQDLIALISLKLSAPLISTLNWKIDWVFVSWLQLRAFLFSQIINHFRSVSIRSAIKA